MGFVVGLVVLGLEGAAGARPVVTVESARLGNTFVLGEAPVLAVTVTAGANTGFRGRLRLRAVDAYGASAGRWTLGVALARGESVTREVPLRVRRLGHFRIAATLRAAGGRRVAAARTTAAVVGAVGEADAEDSAVGYYVLPYDSELPRAREIASQMRRFGIRWVRMTFNWWLDDRTARPDLADPAWLDTAAFEAWVDAFRDNGIEVLGVLLGTARWASSARDATDPLAGIPMWGLVRPLELADWELFVRTLAERLHGRVRSWEVWNEPDIPLFWLSTADDYIALLRATSAVVRETDPLARIVVNMVGRSDEAVAFRTLVLAEAGNEIDVFGMHYGVSDTLEVARGAKAVLRAGGALWNTEAAGAPSRLIARWFQQRAGGVDRLFPFIYRTELDDGAFEVFQQLGQYPVNLDYTPRPDAVAMRTVADMVGTAMPGAVETVGLGYTAYTFTGAAGSVVALVDGNEIGPTWSGRPGVLLQVELPASVERVRVVDLMGNPRTLRVRDGTLRLPMLGVAAFLWPEPAQSLAGLRVVAGEVGP